MGKIEIMTANDDDDVTLTLYKQGLRGTCYDYVIRFREQQHDIQEIIRISSDIVKQLIDDYHQKEMSIKGRLVARVCYLRLNEEEVMYYHPSYRSEVIKDAEKFYTAHMLKIAQRMDDFNKNSSKLIIKNITEIHLHVSCVN